MIYEVPPPSDPIQQGDIFKGIPRIDINLASLSLLEEGEQLETTWQDILAESQKGETIQPYPWQE